MLSVYWSDETKLQMIYHEYILKYYKTYQISFISRSIQLRDVSN